jgi:hypothetical protein
MRTFLLLIALLIVIGITLVYTGAIRTRSDGNGVVVETTDVRVGTETRNVEVPVVTTQTRQVEVPSIGVANSQANKQ